VFYKKVKANPMTELRGVTCRNGITLCLRFIGKR